MKNKKKSSVDYLKEVRSFWAINPRTRIKDNDLKNKKKRRRDEKKIVKNGD
jgi:hypothetical protein